MSDQVMPLSQGDRELQDALDQVTPEFHARWCASARIVRPHQTPPTLAEMKEVLSILLPEDILGILRQFDEPQAERSNLESSVRP